VISVLGELERKRVRTVAAAGFAIESFATFLVAITLFTVGGSRSSWNFLFIHVFRRLLYLSTHGYPGGTTQPSTMTPRGKWHQTGFGFQRHKHYQKI
jgi:hypothetical protein